LDLLAGAVQYVFLKVTFEGIDFPEIFRKLLGNSEKKRGPKDFLSSLPFYPKSQPWEAARDFFEKKERTQGFFT